VTFKTRKSGFKAEHIGFRGPGKVTFEYKKRDNNNNHNNHDDMYSAVIYGESSLWFIWAKVGQRQVAATS